MPRRLPGVAEAPVSPARRWWPRLVALAAGALLTFSFAPFNQWWFALAAPAVLLFQWSRTLVAREGAWLGFAFGVGLYAAGTWWLYISIRSLAPVPVTLLVMAALVLIMAAYQALLGYVVCRWLRPATATGMVLWAPAAWVLVEWWRSWFLSGFPWLSLGYSQTDTWLAGLAPLGGVHLVSFALLAGAGALLLLGRGRDGMRAMALVILVLPWTLGLWLRDVQWTTASGSTRSVAIVQGNIRQDLKWDESQRQNILDTYARLHREALGAQLIVWPEAALPDYANRYTDYLGVVWSASRRAGSDVVMGALREEIRSSGEMPRYYNSMLALGDGDPAYYDKRQLVPFSELVPVPAVVRNWLRQMGLPSESFDRGAARQEVFRLAGMRVAPSICYEDAYPALLRREIRASDVLVTVTNDAWFGRSGARYLHLQIARMRALESRRYLLRAAQDGVSAVIGPDGAVLARAPELEPSVLRARLEPRSGDTPYLVLGDALAMGLAVLALAGRLFGGRIRLKDSS